MRILVTNDDGIGSPALVRLAEWAKKLGEVTVVAPLVEQSGKSHSIDFRNAFEIKRIDLLEGCEAYSVDSTPADCVRFGITGLDRQYDIVFSGVNRGYNIGEDISYSGTIGAIFEAKRLGVKAIALSTDFDSFENAFAELDGVYELIVRNRLLDTADLLNVNFPTTASRGVVITRQGSRFYSDRFVSCGGDMYMQVGQPVPHYGDDLSTDIGAIQSGYVSITPLTYTKTDLAAYDKLKDIEIK
jgi:5'-nucleotidase